jgi:hypothetical protein
MRKAASTLTGLVVIIVFAALIVVVTGFAAHALVNGLMIGWRALP